MGAPLVSKALLQFVDDEMLRAPLLFILVFEGTLNNARKSMATMAPLQRTAAGDLVQALQTRQAHLAEYFLRSLREQVGKELLRKAPQAPPQPRQPSPLALVDEDEVALDVELAHTIEAINSTAESELRELQTYMSALVGDPDVASDHNPFRAETYARALWDAAQALPMSRGHQVAFVRHAGPAMAQLLRTSYASATSRLEAQGVEPAAYRTVIQPTGSRRGWRFGATTFNPDLHRMRETMPAFTEMQPLSLQGRSPQAPHREPGVGAGRAVYSRIDRQSIELVSRLFDAMVADERVPADVSLLISRLHGPATRLSLYDGSMLDRDKHPMWRFINRLAFEAEMAPDATDPERAQLLKTAQATVDQLTSEPEQNGGLYVWALDRLESFLRKRLGRRLSAAASQIGALQKLEDRLTSSQAVPSTMHGTLDVQQLDTVPADLISDCQRAAPANDGGEEWLEQLRSGDWVRMFLQGRWIQPQLLWRGDRREIWLFGDGASDATWAVRRSALLMMHEQALLKGLKQRSIVSSAAARVHKQMTTAAA